MITSELQSIIGRTIRSFTSDFVISEIISDSKIDFRMAYHSQIHLEIDEKPTYQVINIKSKWYEDRSGLDYLEIDFKVDKKYEIKDINLKMPYPSMLSIWERFLVCKIEVFGFNVDFNSKNQTSHIVLFHDNNGRKILVRPEVSALGLYVSVNEKIIGDFFANNQNSEFIYRCDVYE